MNFLLLISIELDSMSKNRSEAVKKKTSFFSSITLSVKILLFGSCVE